MSTTTPAFFDVLVREASEALLPLRGVAGDPARMRDLLRQLGIDLAPSHLDPSFLAEAIAKIAELEPLLDAGSDGGWSIVEVAHAARLIGETVDAVRSCAKALGSSAAALPPEVIADLPRRLFDHLVLSRIASAHPALHGMLRLLGVAAQDGPKSLPFRKLDLGALATALRSAAKWGRDVYGWGTSAFDGSEAVARLAAAARGFGAPSTPWPQRPSVSQKLGRDDAFEVAQREWRIPLLQVGQWPESFALLGLNVCAIEAPAENRGIGAYLFAIGNVEVRDVEFGESALASLDVEADLQRGIGLELRPGRLRLVSEFLGRGPPSDGRAGTPEDTKPITVKASLRPREKREVVLFDVAGARLSVAFPSAELTLRSDGTSGEVMLGVRFDSVRLALSSDPSDGFLARILPGAALPELELDLEYSTSGGLTIGTDASLERSLAVERRLGPLFVRAVTMRLAVDPLALSLTVDGGVDIGPVSCAVEGLGAELRVDPSRSGLLGSADLVAAFVPPSGIGISLSSDVASGGGYLSAEDGTYRGLFALSVRDQVSIEAVGMIATRLPDGRRTFSMKVLARGDFGSAPIQVGLGFSLVALGGLVAIECRMDEAVLREAVYGGTLAPMLFPKDLRRDAPATLARLDAAFPACPGTYVVGALAKIVWGSAAMPLLSADLGIFVEMGSSLALALAAVATIDLPHPQTPIVHVQIQALGFIDVRRKTLALDARLVDSRLASCPLEGEAALRCSWGEPSSFAFAVGGFHPAYVPPAGFPRLRRLSVVVLKDNPNLVFLGYLAATENSRQLGAAVLFSWRDKVPLPWPLSDVRVELSGAAGFDALLQLHPFMFAADLFGVFDLKVNGDPWLALDLRLALSGPNPYAIHGRCKVKIFGAGVTLEIDHVGEKHADDPALPPMDVLSWLDSEIKSKPSNWTAVPRAGYAPSVVLRGTSQARGAVDPLAAELEFVQQTIPLATDFVVTRVGPQPVTTPGQYDVEATALDDQTLSGVAVLKPFARGQFCDLEDGEALSGAPYRAYKAGLAIPIAGPAAVECPAVRTKTMDYEPHVLGGEKVTRVAPGAADWAGSIRRTAHRRHSHVPGLLCARPQPRTAR